MNSQEAGDSFAKLEKGEEVCSASAIISNLIPACMVTMVASGGELLVLRCLPPQFPVPYGIERAGDCSLFTGGMQNVSCLPRSQALMMAMKANRFMKAGMRKIRGQSRKVFPGK